MLPEPCRVIVAGMVAGVPRHGGATWAVLQWVLGLRQLGHDVLLVEPVDDLTPERTAYFNDVVLAFGLRRRAVLVTPSRATVGMAFAELAARTAQADLLLNIGGMLRDAELVEAPATRAYLDLDPAFTQVWHASQGIDMRFDGHTHFVTVGLNVGDPACAVPTCGRSWITTLPPVVLDQWRSGAAPSSGAWTTVANWRGYGNAEHDGVRYGQKAHTWRALVDLPRKTTARFVAALAIDPGEERDLAALAAHRWELVDPSVAAGTPHAYRSFVHHSRGEIGVAKEGYAVSRCGWFSDRSACYLAAGRPVIAQDTGWSSHVPAGEGLYAFATVDEAAAAIAQATSEYPRACGAAQQIAEEILASTRTIPRLLEKLGCA